MEIQNMIPIIKILSLKPAAAPPRKDPIQKTFNLSINAVNNTHYPKEKTNNGGEAPIPTMTDILVSSRAQNLDLQLQTLGPLFRITAKSLETNRELGRAEGLIRVWLGGKILHLDSIRLRRETLGMEKSIFGIGLFVGAVAIRHGFDCGCRTAELLAIYDSDLYHSKSGAFVEAVIMRYDTRLGRYGGKPRLGGPRSTLCVSSQVGCKMGCKFCATGSMGFKNNLLAGEIVEQLVHASCISNIRNIVFMGMGEPLNNYTALVEAIRTMTRSPFQLSPRRVTVSTVGIIHAINKLQYDIPNLNLAVSLHAPVQDIRCQIMPAARAFPLEKLMDALRVYQNNSQQKLFIEYIMLDGVNDEEQHAHQLGKLLETFEVVVNLIPFNPIGDLSRFRTSSEVKVKSFQKVLRSTYNIRTTVRKQMGQDISGACGQLAVNLQEKICTSADRLADIEDLPL